MRTIGPRFHRWTVLSILSGLLTAGTDPSSRVMGEEVPAATAEHSFLCCETKSILRVDTQGKVLWQYPFAGGHDVWSLTNGCVLAAAPGAGIVEVTPEKTVAWSYRPSDGTLYSCQPLPEGRVLTAVRVKDGARIREIARDGSVAKEFATHRAPGDIRLCRKTPEGTYLLAARGVRQVWEYDGEGTLLRELNAPGNVYLGVRTARGTTLIACGDGHAIVEVDKDNRIVWRLSENDLPSIALRFVAGIQELSNGNLVFCNWAGHGGDYKTETQIVEIDRQKKVVWKFDDWKTVALPTHIQLLDQGDAQTRR